MIQNEIRQHIRYQLHTRLLPDHHGDRTVLHEGQQGGKGVLHRREHDPLVDVGDIPLHGELQRMDFHRGGRLRLHVGLVHDHLSRRRADRLPSRLEPHREALAAEPVDLPAPVHTDPLQSEHTAAHERRHRDEFHTLGRGPARIDVQAVRADHRHRHDVDRHYHRFDRPDSQHARGPLGGYGDGCRPGGRAPRDHVHRDAAQPGSDRGVRGAHQGDAPGVVRSDVQRRPLHAALARLDTHHHEHRVRGGRGAAVL